MTLISKTGLRSTQGAEAGALWAASHPQNDTVNLDKEANRAASVRGIRPEDGRAMFVWGFKKRALAILRGYP